MTGEQKPGGLAQKIYDCPTTFDGDAIGTHLGLSMMVDQSTSTVDDQRRVVMSMCEDIARMIQAEPAQGSESGREDLAWLTNLLYDQMDQAPSTREEDGPNEHDRRILRLLAALSPQPSPEPEEGA